MGNGTIIGKFLSSPKRTAAGTRSGRMNRNRMWTLFVVIVLLAGMVSAVGASKPAASFSANISNGSTPLSVQFIDTSSNSPTTWFWSFGDGAVSTVSDPVHIYTNDGSYSVTLTATNAQGSDSLTKPNFVVAVKSASSPAAGFVSTDTTGSKPLTVKFVDTSSNTPTSWTWSFGDGETSTEQNPSHTFTTRGSFTVTLTATNSGGSSTITKQAYVMVSEESMAPVASFITANTEGSAPLTVKFIDTSANGPTSWVWTFGDGTSGIAQNPTHVYATKGDYTVTMTATNSVGSSTSSKLDYISVVEAEPVASFTANITSGTAPLTVMFNDTSEHVPTSWKWLFGDEDNTNVQNPVHTYTTAGDYTVILTATNGAGYNKTTMKKFIHVGEVITPAASFTVNTTTGRAPLTVQFNDTTQNYPTSWEWSFGDGAGSLEQNPVHTYESTGTYTVVLTAANTRGSNAYTLPGGITATGLTPLITSAPAETTEPSSSETVAPTVAPEATVTPASNTSSNLLVPALVIIAAAVVILLLILRRRPPGHGRSHSRDL
jgi:PKD repeat protein